MAKALVGSRDGRRAHLGGCTACVSVGSLAVHDPRGHSPAAAPSTCAGGKAGLAHLSEVMGRCPRVLYGCGHGGLERPTAFPAHTWRRLCAARAAALPDACAPAPPIDAAATALQAQPPAAIVTAAATSDRLPGRSVPPRAPPLGASLVEAAAGRRGGLTARRGHRAAAAAHDSAGRHDLTTCACPTPATGDSRRRDPAREGGRCRGGGDHRRSCSVRVWDGPVGGSRVVCRRRSACLRTSLEAPLALMTPPTGRPRSPARAVGPAPPAGAALTADGPRLAFSRLVWRQLAPAAQLRKASGTGSLPQPYCGPLHPGWCAQSKRRCAMAQLDWLEDLPRDGPRVLLSALFPFAQVDHSQVISRCVVTSQIRPQIAPHRLHARSSGASDWPLALHAHRRWRPSRCFPPRISKMRSGRSCPFATKPPSSLASAAWNTSSSKP